MHSPHRWSSESGESLKGLPHVGQRGDATQGISFQQPLHQDLRSCVSILWQPAQLLGRHKSRRTDPADLKPDPIPRSMPPNGYRPLDAGSRPFFTFVFFLCRLREKVESLSKGKFHAPPREYSVSGVHSAQIIRCHLSIGNLKKKEQNLRGAGSTSQPGADDPVQTKNL